MIRKLVLIRHGQAETRRLFQDDTERHLTPQGLKALREAYPELLAPLAEDVDDLQVWASEAVRARETAEVVCEALGLSEDDIEYHASLYAQDNDYFYGELSAAEGVVVGVGHIPFVEEAAADLARHLISFTTGSIACIDVPDGDLAHATLAWFERGPEV